MRLLHRGDLNQSDTNVHWDFSLVTGSRSFLPSTDHGGGEGHREGCRMQPLESAVVTNAHKCAVRLQKRPGQRLGQLRSVSDWIGRFTSGGRREGMFLDSKGASPHLKSTPFREDSAQVGPGMPRLRSPHQMCGARPFSSSLSPSTVA